MSEEIPNPILVLPGDDYDVFADELNCNCSTEEFCISPFFATDFGAALIQSGFLLMSFFLEADPAVYILLPKLHIKRSVLFFEKRHEPRSVKRIIHKYELRVDYDHESVIDACIKKHGDDWLTPPLIKLLLDIHDGNYPIKIKSFSLFRNGNLVAGEFGTTTGSVYTSYSGFYTENSAGSVQLLLCGRYLHSAGYAFWDLGMPLDYKTRLGAVSIPRHEFIRLFRDARACCPSGQVEP